MLNVSIANFGSPQCYFVYDYIDEFIETVTWPMGFIALCAVIYAVQVRLLLSHTLAFLAFSLSLSRSLSLCYFFLLDCRQFLSSVSPVVFRARAVLREAPAPFCGHDADRHRPLHHRYDKMPSSERRVLTSDHID